MHGILRGTLALPACLAVVTGSLAHALDVGDPVVVHRPAELTTMRGQVAVLTPGTSVVVQAIGESDLTVAVVKIGRIDRSCVIPRSDADSHFSRVIEQDPRDAVAWLARGKV